jgi:hypothetical protein
MERRESSGRRWAEKGNGRGGSCSRLEEEKVREEKKVSIEFR